MSAENDAVLRQYIDEAIRAAVEKDRQEYPPAPRPAHIVEVFDGHTITFLNAAQVVTVVDISPDDGDERACEVWMVGSDDPLILPTDASRVAEALAGGDNIWHAT